MASGEDQPPDLASVLRRLASLQGEQPRQEQPIQNPQPQHYATPFMPPPQQPWQQPSHAQMAPRPPPADYVKVIDPATIIDWPSGLKCVMRTVTKRESMLQEIRKLIKVQQENEENWFKGRQGLIEKQKARKEGQKRLDEVLKMVGGATGTGVSNTTPEEMASELRTFDMKVYKAQLQMNDEFTARLKRLGVPFFGTNPGLVREFGKVDEDDGSTNPRFEPGTIDETELVKLQKKMISILEDLAAD